MGLRSCRLLHRSRTQEKRLSQFQFHVNESRIPHFYTPSLKLVHPRQKWVLWLTKVLSHNPLSSKDKENLYTIISINNPLIKFLLINLWLLLKLKIVLRSEWTMKVYTLLPFSGVNVCKRINRSSDLYSHSTLTNWTTNRKEYTRRKGTSTGWWL